MTREETVALVRFIKAVSPAQAIDEWTPNFWHDIIGHLDFEAARHAVISVKWRKAFVDPSDIIAELERREHHHPSECTAAEAIAASSARELEAVPAGPPNAAYLAAKDQMIAKFKERDEAAVLHDHQAERRANAWLEYKLSGKLPPQFPLSGPPHPRWVQLPGDPPELREWLARQSVAPDDPN